MNSRDRELLRTALGDMPEGFHLTDGDDFINVRPKLFNRDIRAVRIIGAGRMLMLFQYDTITVGWSYRRSQYTVHYLNEHNELVEFDPDVAKAEAAKAAMANWAASHTKPWTPRSIGWERAVGWWLEQQGARQFKGRGWAADCAMKVLNLTARWQKRHPDLEIGA